MNRTFKLKSVTLFNFYNYLGKNQIRFDTDSDKNIYLFDMKNGSGKTSLFHAIKWGFYGPRFDYRKTGKKMSLKDFMNKSAKPDEGFYVEIHFYHDDDVVVAKRICNDPKSGKQELVLNVNGVVHYEPNSSRILNLYVPENYGSFFMFDGEELSELADAQNDSKQVESVLQLLGLKDLNDLKDRLSRISKDFKNDRDGHNTKEDKDRSRQNEISDINAQIITLDEKILGERNRQREIQITINELKEGLEGLGDADVGRATKLKKELDNEKTKWLGEKISNNKELDSNKQNLFLKFIHSDLENIAQDLNKRKTEITGVTESPMEHIGITKIKEKILGEHLAECPVCRNIITTESSNFIIDSMEMDRNILDVYNRNREELNHIENFSDLLKNLSNKSNFDFQRHIDSFHIAEIEIEKIIEKQERLEKEMKESGIEAARELANRISNNSENLASSKNAVERFEEEKAGYVRRREKLEKESTANSKIGSLSRKYDRLYKRSERLIEGLEIILDKGTKRKREEILQKANEFFLKMTNKKDIYKGLRYKNDSTYSMDIIKSNGKISPNPSAGEMQVVAMSFLIALTKCTGRTTPILMDTPLSKLDKEHSSNIGEALAGLDNQVLFLAQPMELSPVVMDSMRDSLAQKFIPRLSPENNVTILEEKI